MAVIHFVNLDPTIIMAVRNGIYTEEDIIILNKKIMADEKKKKKTFVVVMIALSLLLLVGGIIIYGSQIGFPEALPLLLMNMSVVAIVAPVSWYAAIGRMSKQWDDLMRLYYPSIYMDNKYGKTGQDIDVSEDPKPVKKPKAEISGKSILKNSYYIITIIMSALLMVLFVIVGISAITSKRGTSDMKGAYTSIVLAGIAAGSFILSVKGLRRSCYIPGIILEKAGVLFAGFGLIVCITGFFSQGKMTEALAIFVPAFIIGAVCFIGGIKMINRKSVKH